MVVAAGITTVSAAAATAGILSLPLPINDIEWPWLWWDSAFVGNENYAASNTTLDLSAANRVIDSKAMRKVPPSHVCVLVFQAGVALKGAPDANVSFIVRILLMPS